jgi:hypothetical protein
MDAEVTESLSHRCHDRQTARRIACSDGIIPILFDDNGAALRLGRSRRLFSANQHTVLAAVWGGCAHPSCERPPSWTEAHHVDEWKKHKGRTDVADGVLLCRHHHMFVHNNQWRIRRHGTAYLLEPPPGDVLHRHAIPLIPKNLVHRRAMARAVSA